MMVFTNEMTKAGQRPRAFSNRLSCSWRLSRPIWRKNCGRCSDHRPSVSRQPWPIFDPALTVSDRLTIPDPGERKVAGKTRRGADAAREQVEGLARAQIAEWLQGNEPKKIIYVEKKLMNFVV